MLAGTRRRQTDKPCVTGHSLRESLGRRLHTFVHVCDQFLCCFCCWLTLVIHPCPWMMMCQVGSYKNQSHIVLSHLIRSFLSSGCSENWTIVFSPKGKEEREREADIWHSAILGTLCKAICLPMRIRAKESKIIVVVDGRKLGEHGP
jgi:hypothetical protein